MKRSLILLLLISFSAGLFSCKKDCFYNARVLEYDTRKCACCGGLVIEVDGKTYQAFLYPDVLSPEVRTEFPYGVNIEYTLREKGDGCSVADGLIDVTAASF